MDNSRTVGVTQNELEEDPKEDEVNTAEWERKSRRPQKQEER